MPIKFLIVDTYYTRFLSSHYDKFPNLAYSDYAVQLESIMTQCFGTADFYSENLKKLNCDAKDVIANNEILQRQWAKENGLNLRNSFMSRALGRLPLAKRLFPPRDFSLIVLEAQIKKDRPDVLYLQDLSFCPPDFITTIRKYVKLVVGQIACPLPPLGNLKGYDLILTSFPHYVDMFRKMGIKSEYFKIAFDSSVLDKSGRQEKKFACTFVGGIGPAHKKGTALLEELARRVEMDFFGYGAEILDKASPILPRHHGEVWGLDMYRALLSSRIAINRHIDVAENYANNMRLYEATGCGALLLTDYKDNLNNLFEIGKEVVAYNSVDELVDLIKYYSAHEYEGQQIADNGQKRTLREHTYFNRMSELIDIIDKYLR